MRLTHSRCAPDFHLKNARRAKAAPLLQHAVFEALENRQLMSGSAALVSGILTVVGDSSASSNIQLNLANNGADINANNGHGPSLNVATSSVKGIKITGGSGVDYIYIDHGITVPAIIAGGDGNDQIRGGGGVNTITDGNGNDWISGRGTRNSITAGNGNDTVLGATGADTLVAGNGNDSIDGSDGNDSITCGNGNDTVTGDSGNDTITAGNGKDSLSGGADNDKIIVGTGLSTVSPGTGTNYVQESNKSDKLVSSSGTTTVSYVVASAAASTGSSGTTTTTTTGGSTTSTAPASGTSPTPVIQVVSSVTTVGIGVVVDGLSSKLGTGSVIDSNYVWDFGDSGGEYNTLSGFNASHIYTVAGTYKISLTVTNELNLSTTVSTNVVISSDSRKVIYVDSMHGNDSNSGLTTSSPLKTAAEADAKLGANTEVLFARGETFDLGSAFTLDYQNVLVGSYGSGAQPIINYTAPSSDAVVFSTNSSAANGVTIQDLTITTLNGSEPTLTDMPMAVMAGGYDTSVLRCTFDYVEYDINSSSNPVGLNVFDNSSPIDGGLQGYFVWDQATDSTIVGNTVNGSVKEHVVRTSGAVNLLIAQNNFSNYDGKGCIEVHVGDDAWVDGNTVNSGDIRVGPLGLWGEPVTDSTSNCVIQNNVVTNSWIQVDPGSNSIAIRNNIIHNDGTIIDVKGQNGLGLQSSDIQIMNNTGISTGTAGQFLKMESHTDGIILENNLLVEPGLAVGAYNAAPVFVEESDLSSFTQITGNVWQLPKTVYSTANGGVNYLDSNYVTTTVWNSQSKVGTDFFYNTAIDASGAPTVGLAAATVDSAIEGVFGDINGDSRPTSGSWSAGATQV